MSNPVGAQAGAPLDITGYVFAWKIDRPQLITFDGERWLPIFANLEELLVCMTGLGVEGFTVKRIDDGLDFLASVAENNGIRVCTGLHRHENGRLRFHWVQGTP